MRRILCCAVVLLITVCQHVSAQKREKFDRGIEQQTFIPKGQWVTGGNISYSQHSNDNYKFLVIENWDGKGYNFNVSPFVGYTFKNNLTAGARFTYSRNLLQVDNMDIELDDDLNFDLDNVYRLTHGFHGTAFLRTYINLGESKRFGLFNDVRLTIGGGQAKMISGSGRDLTGTFEKTVDLQIGVSPGLVAFINNFIAAEVSVGVLGFNFKWIDQTTDQIYTGSRRSSSGNFKINLFSISLGLAFYL